MAMQNINDDKSDDKSDNKSRAIDKVTQDLIIENEKARSDEVQKILQKRLFNKMK